MSSALTASFSVRQPPNELFVLSCRQLDHVCHVDAEEDVQDFRPLSPGLDPPEIVVLFPCPERAFHRSRPHSGKYLSDKVFLLFLLTERTASFYERCLYPVRLAVVPVFSSPRSQCLLRPFSLRLQTVSCASSGSAPDGSLH